MDFDQEITQTASKRDTTSLADIPNEDSAFLRVVPSQNTIKPSTNKADSVTSKPFKNGFLNAKSSSGAKAKSDKVPFIQASKKAAKVPEFLKLHLKDVPEKQQRRELKELMKPTQELVSEVLSNKEIQAGLEDSEIMMAVQDIASNPSSMHKYKHYPKIVNFYNNMGKLMGDCIEKQEKEEKNHRSDSTGI